MIDERMDNWWNDNWQGKTEILEKVTCPRATLSTTNPMWTALGLNLGLRGE
jgi:hypothetical protein